METKNKDNVVMKVKFECHAGFEDDHDTLPIKIYYPKQKTEGPEETAIYTRPDLEAMTVTEIESLAAQRGYTLAGSNKEENIASFLARQSGGEK